MGNKIYSDFYLSKKHQILHCEKPTSAYLQYKFFRINLLTGDRESYSAKNFLDSLEKFKLSSFYKNPYVFHFFYEFGHICLEQEDLLSENKPLGLFIDYSSGHLEQISSLPQDNNFNFEPIEHLKFSHYKKKFKKVRDHLLSGDCYQLNLTMPFYFKFKELIGPREFMQRLWADPSKVGAYAHGTYVEALDQLFFSNSPECLFQINQNKIQTMPIKGTIEIEEGDDRQEKWDELKNSTKDESELFMITDLMRNDLTKIELIPAKVIRKKAPLHVPGLIHQYSVIENKLSKNADLKKLLKAIFPGGSITGAPKKRVMQLINDIEGFERGLYCGSTILFYKGLKSGSINIRSTKIDFTQNEIKYGAGGGVTLLSKASDEYKEALGKLKSFLLLFQD